LGRPISTTLPDTSATIYSYTANTLTITDPTGKKRKTQADGLGRLATVFEPDSGGSLTQQTTYTYNVLDALLTVSGVGGLQTRTYGYDHMGRLTSVKTPETNNTATGYQYDNFNNLTQRTDPRGVITTYSYDNLNRLYQVSYNVGSTGVTATPTVTYTYGTNSAQNDNGRLITLTDGVGSESYSYDPNLPLATQVQKVLSGTTYTTGYQYNLAGELKQTTYPSGRVVQQNYDPIGRLCAIAQTTGSTCSTNTNPYATGFAYNTAFELTGFNYANGVAATFGYSADRLQMTSLSYVKGTTSLYSLNYSYGAAGSNNGQIQSITDNVDNGRSVTFSYDNLARLTNAVTTGSTGYPKWGLQWLYDVYGNRTQQNISSGCTGLTCPTNQVAVSTATNRITTTGYAYDANGNMTNDGVNTLTYDGENHLLTSSGTLGSGTYTYDGKGLRVRKASGTTTTVYSFSGSKVIAEYVNGAAPGSPTREYIYSGSALLAKVEGTATQYYHSDHLSARVMTDSSGNKIGEQGHFPYGETWYATNTTTKWEFTTYERDSESGNDYAMARYHVNRLGRFSSPDLLAGSSGDPQSLNKYSYVRNDPANLVDPSGQLWSWICGFMNLCGSEGPPYYPSRFELCELAPGLCPGAYTGGEPDGGREADRGDLQKKLAKAKVLVHKILSGDNPCSQFFNSADDLIIASALAGGVTTADQLFSTQTVSPVLVTTATIGAQTFGTGKGAVILLNQPGPFYYPKGIDSHGKTVPLQEGPYAGGSPEAQATILLHEIAHTLNLIPSDKPAQDPRGDINNANTQTILDNCKQAIDDAIKALNNL
jgi:RHS repeat-associated protein